MRARIARTVATELVSHIRDGLRENVIRQTESMERLRSEDMAEVVSFIVHEILVQAGGQTR
ncbi:hypothetical protein ACIBQ1_56945 [Nonomuraea sp. NPDC050153]|uniref:hypothetical protein n=1 Tax=Nonomuraea sp. NPDC050153 TaxID=3364359 RepID=UPI00379F6498